MVEIKVARTREEREEIYRLRYRVFVEEMKSVNPSKYPDQMLYDEYDEMDKTVIFFAANEGRAVGSIRIIQDEPRGLPMDSYVDFHEFRGKHKIAECSRLLTAPEYRKRNADFILMGLVKIGFIWSVHKGIEFIAITARQEVAKSFFSKVGFKAIAEPVNLPDFNDPNALPMGLKLTDIIDPCRSFIMRETKNIEEPYQYLSEDYFQEKVRVNS